MSMKPLIITKELSVAAATAAATVVWRAPCAGRIVRVHGRRSGGTSAAVNAQIGATDVLAADLTAGNAVYASAVPTGNAGKFAAGAVISLEVAAAVGTPAVLVQADIVLDSDVKATA